MKPTLVAALCCLACLTASAANQPNIIFIMADDLGNADVGYHGGQVKTPNIDKLAAEGVRLESFYGMPVCTPVTRVLDDGPLCDALRSSDAGDLSEPHLWPAY